jgi:hypothetical protein
VKLGCALAAKTGENCGLEASLRWALALSWSITSAIAAAQAPSPIVERSLTVAGRTVRTSLFDNRVAVVSVTRDGERTVFRQMTITEAEFIGYLAAVQRDAEEIAKAERRPKVESMGGSGVMTIHIGPAAPFTVKYSPVAVLDLATARLVAALDDLERRVVWGEPPVTELLDWRPQRGDRVELRAGGIARVIEIREDGSIVLEHEDVAINEIVAPESRVKVVLRVLEDDP